MTLQSLLKAVAVLVWGTLAASAPSPASINSDLTILLDNTLQGASSPTADSGVLLLSARNYQDAVSGCQAMSEELWSPSRGRASIQPNLDYLVYEGRAEMNSRFWIAAHGNETRALSASGHVATAQSGQKLAVLCTNSAPFANSSFADNSARWQVVVKSNREDVVGFRDRTSFRFYGIRYAPQPERFTYSKPYVGSNTSSPATEFGPTCAQYSSGSEDCLFLNIWTPYLPRPGSQSDKSTLKPVMFWLHGGAFTGGSGSDNVVDGGSIASRGDVVLVTINYRVSTLGFLALDDGVTNGNFGLADQINALEWVRANIRDFGGDPDRITLIGQSAGAASVRALIASPKTEKMFAGAVPMSNLGGLGDGTPYSEYYTIAQEVHEAANAILDATNCTAAASQVDCLRGIPASTLTGLSMQARFIVVDGTYITTENATLTGPQAPYKLLMGVMKEDATPFLTYPTTTNQTEFLAANRWNVSQSTLDQFYPIPAGPNQTLSLFNATAHLATDGNLRCADQAIVFSSLESGQHHSVYYYEFERSYQLPFYTAANCEPPVTAEHPHGDPKLPYFRCHSGELYYLFGNLAFQGLPERDENDLPFEQFVLDSFTSFARTYDPNPDRGFLEARRYTSTAGEMARAGRWEAATRGDLTLRALAWDSYQDSFRELDKCAALGIPLTYWEGAGK